MAFFHYSQNNSGGSFRTDAARGIAHHVIIEAESSATADDRAEKIGLYFDGCAKDIDCPCCGDRWSRQWSDSDATDEPRVYNRTPEAAAADSIWGLDPEVSVHYADGRVVNFK